MEYFRSHVLICGGDACKAGGCDAVRSAFADEIERQGLSKEIRLLETGCLGPCEAGPVAIVYPEGVTYVRLGPDDARLIVKEHLLKGRVVSRLMAEPHSAESAGAVVEYRRTDIMAPQERIVLKNAGKINPDSIEDYIAKDGYQALGKCLTRMSPQEVIDTIKASGLRGRGGAAFPTGLKWEFTAKAQADQKYIVCNADEGEPGTFKDRLILEGDPHSIIEAMAIAGYASGASMGFIYIRGEYRLSIDRLNRAISQARRYGLLGSDVFSSGFSFDVEVKEGAGAYVCGEETALIESIEGKRGEPRLKPPYPGTYGLWGKPTIVNNVETLANVPSIILEGAQWFRGFGTEKSPGTKVFTLIGDIGKPGLIEVPFGMTLRQVIFEVGGGIPGGRRFKLAQVGGTTGGCVSEELLDLPLDYDAFAKAGQTLGSGALLVIDDTHCIVDICKVFLRFCRHESCGQCTPCREGTDRMYEILERLEDGQGREGDLELLDTLSRVMQSSSLCGLGQAAPTPVVTALRYFKDEFEGHIGHSRCSYVVHSS